MNILEAKELIRDIINHDTTLNPCMIGGSGLGKSTIAEEIASETKRHYSYLPVRSDDALGINIPLKGTGKLFFIPHEKVQAAIDKPTLLFIDEINRADRYTRASLMELLSEKSAGGYKLHPESVVLLALNDESEKYDTIEQDQAFKTRVLPVPVQFDVEPSKEFARKNNYHAMMAFLEEYPDVCNEAIAWNIEKPDPRMLVRLNRLLNVPTKRKYKSEVIKFVLGKKAAPFLKPLKTMNDEIVEKVASSVGSDLIGTLEKVMKAV